MMNKSLRVNKEHIKSEFQAPAKATGIFFLRICAFAMPMLLKSAKPLTQRSLLPSWWWYMGCTFLSATQTRSHASISTHTHTFIHCWRELLCKAPSCKPVHTPQPPCNLHVSLHVRRLLTEPTNTSLLIK